MIRTIFFDLGKVLADFDWKPASHMIAESSIMTAGEVYTVCTSSAMAIEYETGKISTNLFFEKLKTEIGFSGSTETLCDLWSDIFTPIAKNVSLLEKVLKTYQVGLISNTNEAHVEWITDKFRFLGWFPNPTYSYVAGCLKPKEEIYLKALSSLSASAPESLFIDDLDVNVSSAQRLGMSVIHLTPDKDLEMELKKFEITGIN